MTTRVHLLCMGMLVLSGTVRAAQQPNVLAILADDCTYNDLPMYGGKNARTPALERLAQEGLVFNRAYLSSAMCQPCRAALYTGQFPLRNGCAYNHAACRPETRSLPHYLKPLGYRVGIAGKTHTQPKAAFPFEMIAGFDRSCVRNPTRAHTLAPAREFMTRRADQPFCLVIALVEPHVPWVMGDRSAYPPESLKLPPNIADTPITRKEYAAYVAEIGHMDSQVRDILQALETTGKAEDTLVLFSSEQGSQFPGCKWTNWDTGLHTALIARWPGVVPVAKRTDALVQYVDVLPTLLELAGGEPAPSHSPWDGSSFAAVLRGQSQAHRTYVYGIHNNIPEGPAYPIRTVTNGEFRYIRNLRPDTLYIEKHVMGFDGEAPLRNRYWATWVSGSWNDPATHALVQRYMMRPAESLYHTTTDPYELMDLAGRPEYRRMTATLAAELDRWMEQQHDPGAAQDTHQAFQAAKKGEHRPFSAP